MAEATPVKDHANRSPSGAKARKLCPGKVVLEAGREDRPSIYAAEGTVAHTVMELCLTENKDAEAYVGRVFEADGFTFEVGMDMADHVNTFIAHVNDLIDTSRGDVLLVEQQVPVGFITGEEGATGTADVIGICENGTHLVVADLKYGKGVVPVSYAEPMDRNGVIRETLNEQLSSYGNGALHEYEMLYPIERVTLLIGQPRKDHFDYIEVSVDDLRADIKRLKAIELKCDSAEADAKAAFFAATYLRPSEDACRFCKAKAVCPALQGEVTELVGEASSPEDFVDLTAATFEHAGQQGVEDMPTEGNARLAALLAKVPLVEQWCKSIRAEVEAEVFAGREVPGYKLVAGKRGNRQWRDAVEVAEALKAARVKVDEAYDRKLKTPPALEKALAKEKPRVWAKLQDFIVQSEGQPSVAPIDDPREPLDLTASAESFPDLSVADGSDLL